MARWYLRTRPRRRRAHIVAGFTREDSRCTVTWAASRDDARFFSTRAVALAYAAQIDAACGWRRKLVAVNADKAARPPAAFKPRNTVTPIAQESYRLALAVASAREHARLAGLMLPDFNVYLTEGRRTCRGGRKAGEYFISIDRWSFAAEAEKPGYLTYIVAHELAHVADMYHHGTTSHGPQFMAHLRKLCPLKLQAYELGYKPTAARAAGIRLADSAPEVAAAMRPKLTARPIPANILDIIERAKAQLKAEEEKAYGGNS